MNDWIDLSALGKIVIGALICGAGLPALFAVGLRLLHAGSPTTSGAESDRLVGTNPAAIAAACVCFLVVLAAIAWGIYLIVNT
jgi:hypothetical protein